jgi:hypothetical protein
VGAVVVLAARGSRIQRRRDRERKRTKVVGQIITEALMSHCTYINKHDLPVCVSQAIHRHAPSSSRVAVDALVTLSSISANDHGCNLHTNLLGF